jgi:hypothetical protein
MARGGGDGPAKKPMAKNTIGSPTKRVAIKCVCVSVCVCVREGARARASVSI